MFGASSWGRRRGEQRLQSLPRGGIAAPSSRWYSFLVRPNQGFVLPQQILTPEDQMAQW